MTRDPSPEDPTPTASPGGGSDHGGAEGPARDGRWFFWPDALALVAMVLWLALPAGEWSRRWLLLPHGDGAYHLLNILALQEQFLRGGGPGILLLWTDPQSYPPLPHAVPALLGALLGGLDYAGMAHLQFLWVGVLTLATYVLALHVFGAGPARSGRRVGLVAALLVTFAPTTLAYVPEFLQELPVAAMLMVALASLAWARDLDRTGPAWVAGMAVAGLLLTKASGLLYLAPALLCLTVRVLRARPPRERLRALALLALLALGLAGAAGLALRFPLPRVEALGWLRPGPFGFMLAGLGAGCLTLHLVARALLDPGPARNLVLSALVAAFLTAPFYLAHVGDFAQYLRDHEATTTTPGDLDYVESFLPQPLILGEAVGIPVALLVAASLVWSAAAGPRNSLGLVGLPLLGGLAARQFLRLVDYRYVLPGLPLEILTTTGWLLTARPTRAPATALLVALGLWNAAVWTTGGPEPRLPGHVGEARQAWPQDMPELARSLARELGPGPHAMWTLCPWQANPSHALQVTALLEGLPLVVRQGPGDPRQTHARGAWVSVTRTVSLLEPRLSRPQLQALSAGSPEVTSPAWLLVLGPTGWAPSLPEAPAGLGPARELPAPAGMQAWLYPWRPALPDEEAPGAPVRRQPAGPPAP